MEGTGVVPVMNMNRGYDNDWGNGCGMWFMWIIVIFALMGGWGNGFGNNRGLNEALNRSDLQAGFDNQSVQRGIAGIQNGLCDGFYAQNTTMLNGFNGVQRDLMSNGYQLGNQIAENRFAAQQCCCETQKGIANVGCETNRNIDSVRAENYKNTCEIVNAINADGEKTRAVMVANTIQELRDKLADRDRDLQTANFQLSQQAQSAALIGALRPFPQPAFLTCSPYQSVANNVCGCV